METITDRTGLCTEQITFIENLATATLSGPKMVDHLLLAAETSTPIKLFDAVMVMNPDLRTLYMTAPIQGWVRHIFNARVKVTLENKGHVNAYAGVA